MQPIALPILVLVALLISLIGHPRLTLAAAVLCTVLAMAIVLIPTPASIGMSFGPLLLLIGWQPRAPSSR